MQFFGGGCQRLGYCEDENGWQYSFKIGDYGGNGVCQFYDMIVYSKKDGGDYV